MLDFHQLAAQIQTFTKDRTSARQRLLDALAEAMSRLMRGAPVWIETQSRIEIGRTSWMLAHWTERPDAVYDAPERPVSSLVMATDGSPIIADRHDPVLCYVINIGTIVLRYGAASSATLRSKPMLAAPDETLLNVFHGDQEPISRQRFSNRFRLEEARALAETIEQECAAPNSPPAVALVDGSLIFWQLESERDAAYSAATLAAFEQTLDRARRLNVPVAGYISSSLSKDVVNALRIVACEFPKPDCETHCNTRIGTPEYTPPPCSGAEGVTDTDLFALLLQPGQRSTVFWSSSKILKSYAPHNRVGFFYLNTGREVARVEIPAWTAQDPLLLAQTHALCLDQALKGDGYPVALAEAHEQAVVRGAERAAFFALLERQGVGEGIPATTTRKALSKRARRI